MDPAGGAAGMRGGRRPRVHPTTGRSCIPRLRRVVHAPSRVVYACAISISPRRRGRDRVTAVGWVGCDGRGRIAWVGVWRIACIIIIIMG